MSKIKLFLFCSFLSIGFKSQEINDWITNPVDYVNPLMGTQSSYELSNGNTYPIIGLPWGMNYWTPQNGKNGNGWQYTYNSNKIQGFKQTHQPSPWMNDYGQFSILPIVGNPEIDQEKRASWFSHKTEIANPYYYKVYLADYDVWTEIAPTERSAMMRFTFPETNQAQILLDAFDRGSYVRIIPSERKIIGYSTRYARGKMENFKNYFVIQFDKDFVSQNVWSGTEIQKSILEIKADHVGSLVKFPHLKKGEQITIRVASSFISQEQAEINLEESKGKSFDQVKSEAKEIWNLTLNKIQIKGTTIDQARTFYSCLYRSVLFPQKLYEKDRNGNIQHYSPYNGKIMPGYLFGGTGFWDTFRALYPLLNLVYPSMNVEMQKGLISAYQEGGFLPEWSSPGFADIMIGNNSASVVSEAYLKGLRGYDAEILWQALKHGANNEGPMSAVGRKGVADYNSIGYVPTDTGINESAARTLEYAYDDYAIYEFGKALNKSEEELEPFKSRAMNYKKLFDPKYNLMRGKKKNGEFQENFDPFEWGNAFTEGNSWHYTWSVFQDINGLKELMGGKQQFVKMLDSVFVMPPTFNTNYYKEVIHEMREMQIVGMGQYAHGNQPIQHMLYLYNYAGQPWKTQYWVRQVMDKLYKPTPDGYCGDEDNGQTSAWYVFSALGFYPVTPASTQYVLGAPLFKSIKINLENSKAIQIEAPKNSENNIYINQLKFNSKNYSKNWIDHFELLKGAKLKFDMSSKPNTERGIQDSDAPFSMSTPDK
ncbi:GH92 family glycosyl hydrolase [Epilithonimonas zeae]|uniref:Alpha-1,2-mannosidase, putative n=1 Tax=Epilithonimonas zeae TaxID=1416779 RepID=A0A1N6EQ61_9FLAO|nr:GH92 family glycosyl hydrolase [Epilithonimonas zeae]SIN85145.1 alpha-1,2-mannosidase, putative [Epilithonimonas zeae]